MKFYDKFRSCLLFTHFPKPPSLISQVYRFYYGCLHPLLSHIHTHKITHIKNECDVMHHKLKGENIYLFRELFEDAYDSSTF